jgi:hypothetical protein
MVLINECVKIGDKYYLKSEVYKIIEARTDEVFPDDV